MGLTGLTHAVIGVRDLERSVEFYSGVLGLAPLGDEIGRPGVTRRVLASGERRLVLEEVAKDTTSTWTNDSTQLGMRHVGLKVAEVDPVAEALRDAGATFTIEPRDAFGGVRLAFFLDPDGALLEIVEGDLAYTHVHSPVAVARERALPRPDGPRLDHVAVTVSDLERSLRFYRDRCGFPVLGELSQAGEARGLVLTYLDAGPNVLELFSFDVETKPDDRDGSITRPGLDRLGFSSEGPGRTSPLLGEAPAAPAVPLSDPDGTPIELV